MSTIDLSLPDSVPEMARYEDRPMTLDSFAIYNLLAPQNEPPDLVERCNSECPRDDYVHFRTSPDITSLKGLISYHLSTTVHDNFDPNYFLVVTDPVWEHKGVCVVTLGDEEGKPDKFMIKTAESGLLLVNLQIGNTDWYEAKENYEFTGDDDEDEKQDSETGTFPDGASRKRPGTGFYIAFYAIPGIDPSQLIRDVEPFYDGKEPQDRVCRFEGFLNSDRDLVSQAMDSWHPQACMSNTLLCKMYFFVVDSKDYKEDGILLCNVKEHKTKRVLCSPGVTVAEFCDIAQGDKGWDEGSVQQTS